MSQLIFEKPQIAILGFRKRKECSLLRSTTQFGYNRIICRYLYMLLQLNCWYFYWLPFNLNLLKYSFTCLSVRWYASKPFCQYTCLVAHVTLIWKHVVIWETTFRRYVKKTVNTYLNKWVFSKSWGLHIHKLKDYKRLFGNWHPQILLDLLSLKTNFTFLWFTLILINFPLGY